MKALIGNQIKKVARLDRHGFFASQNKSKKASCLPLSVTYNGTLPNIKNIATLIQNIHKQHWYLLKIDPTLEETFQQIPIIAFRRNRNLRDIIGGNKIDFIKTKRKSSFVATGKCTPCLSNNRTLCCRQIIKTATF